MKKDSPKNKPLIKDHEKHDCDNLLKEIEILKLQLDESRQQSLRAMADYQNLEKRQEREKQEWIKYANTSLLLKFLNVADDLDRASLFIKDSGLDMIKNNLHIILKEFGVEEIEVLGKKFDPIIMEAVDKKEGNDNEVLEVQQKGYTIDDRVLRPAKVVVGTGKNS